MSWLTPWPTENAPSSLVLPSPTPVTVPRTVPQRSPPTRSSPTRFSKTAVKSFPYLIDSTQLCASQNGAPLFIGAASTPADITSNIVCLDGGEAGSPFDNKTAIVQGDICKIGDNTGLCSASGECPETGICDAGLAVDAEGCDDAMNACNTGLYCSENKCTANLVADADCSAAPTACEFGTSCLEVSDSAGANTKTTCAKWFSVENSNQVTYKGGNDATLWHFCASAFVFTNGDETPKEFCMPASTTAGDVTMALEKCTVTAFEDPTNLETKAEKDNAAKCGFNSDDKKYCPAQVGDAPVADKITSLKEKLVAQIGKCNSQSFSASAAALSTESIACSALATSFNEDEVLASAVQLPFLRNEDQGNVNVANNPDCAKHTILFSFYGANSVVVTSVLAGVLSFFYMI